ncbi:MAG: adenosine kinase [Opitutaceae bacterium]|nr:adenosine kinase [Opitutaceae bacterium]
MQSSGSARSHFDLIGVGSPIMDLMAPIPDAFLRRVAGEKGGMVLVNDAEMQSILQMLPTAPAQSTGGSAANVTFNASRLGLRTTFLGKLGNDAVARRYRSEFEGAGVDGSRFKQGDQANARCLAMVTPDAQRTLRTDLGAALTLAPEEIRVSDFAGCRHAHIEGYLAFNRALAESALAAARGAGSTVSFDLSSFEVVGATRDWLFSQFKHGIDVVFANEDEIRALFPSRATATYDDLARELGSLGVLAAVKVGADGAWLAQNGSIERIEPVRVPDVVDTNGAGDAWAAGFLYGYLHGWPHRRSGALASHMGAETVRHMGPIIPSTHWSEVKTRGLSPAAVRSPTELEGHAPS